MLRIKQTMLSSILGLSIVSMNEEGDKMRVLRGDVSEAVWVGLFQATESCFRRLRVLGFAELRRFPPVASGTGWLVMSERA